MLMGCDQSADQIQRERQEQIELQGVQSVGMPAITKFAEKRLLKQILEMRDQEIPTITYYADMNGKLHKLCDSIGFGIPYATQYTNPQKFVSAHNSTAPQADPNGLFSPASAEGTWVSCVNPQTHNAAPMYIEERIIVSSWDLDTVKK